jgi:predicted DNA-binding transcriptional regulator AlpA
MMLKLIHNKSREFTNMALVGLRVNSTYRYVAAGAFPRPRKFGRSSFWVSAEVNDWIAKRTAGVPLDLNDICTSDDARAG